MRELSESELQQVSGGTGAGGGHQMDLVPLGGKGGISGEFGASLDPKGAFGGDCSVSPGGIGGMTGEF
jgi:bacteriocin-like protein